MDFMTEQLKIAGEEVDAKFGSAYEKLASDRSHAEMALASSVNGLNDALAKQAALADSRFEKTVSDIQVARKEASDAVAELRSDFATELIATTALVKRVETNLADQVATVSGEVVDYRAFQLRVNRKVQKEKERIEELSNKRFTESKKARGKLRQLMDENKQAAAAEVKALGKDLDAKVAKLRAQNARNKIEMQKDLSKATQAFYEKSSNVQKANLAAIGELNTATKAAGLAAENELKRAKKAWTSKIVMLTNTVTANAKKAEAGLSALSGVVHNTAKANAADRQLIRDQTKIMEADLNKALNRAISIGEAKAKAVEQRIAEHLKNTKRFLQVELNESVEQAADNVFKI